MPELNTSSFTEQTALIKHSIDQLKHDRHAELLFSAIEHFIKIYQSNHLKKELFSYVENHLSTLGITGFLHPDNPTPSTTLSSLKNALLTLNQDQLNQLDDALFGDHAFESIGKHKTFKNSIEVWQNKYPIHRRSGRLYSAMPEDQPLTPAASLKHYYQTLLTDLRYYHEKTKDDLSSCSEKTHSLCSNLIVLEHLQYLDSHFQTPNLPLNDKIALIQLTHDECLRYFSDPLERTTLSPADKQDLKESFSKLIRLILSQYLHDHQFSIFNSAPAEHLRQALITCCIEMQDRTSPKNKQGKTKKRTSTYNGKKHPNFMQCQEAIEVAIQTFQQQDLASTGVFFYQEDNTSPVFLVTFIQQHWRHHQHSQHFQDLLHRYWQHFSETLNPLWESTTSDTDEQFNHAVCTHLYNFLLPEIENIHRIALVLDCIQEASRLPATSEVELARLREIKDLIQLKINQKFDQIGSKLNDELLRFFGHTEDPLSFQQKWHTMPTQDIQLESPQSIQAIRTLLLDCSGEKRQALMARIIDQYKDDANKDRSDKRAACQGMIQAIQRSLSTANHIADICWRYTQDQTRQKTQEITTSGYFIPNIDQEVSRSAVIPGCFGPHDLTKGQSAFKKGIDELQPSQEPLWRTGRHLDQQDNDSGYEEDSEYEEPTERRPSIIPEAPKYPPPAPPTDTPSITSVRERGIIVAPQQYLDGTGLAAEGPTPEERVILDPPQSLGSTGSAAKEPTSKKRVTVDPPQSLDGNGLDAEEPGMINHQDATIMPPPPKKKEEEKVNLSAERISSSITTPHTTIIPPPPPPKKKEGSTIKETTTIDGPSTTLRGVKEGEPSRGAEFAALLQMGAKGLKSPDEPHAPPRGAPFAELLKKGAKELKSSRGKSHSAPQENSKNRSGLFAILAEKIPQRRAALDQGRQPLLEEEGQRESMNSTGSWS